jgi:hypothetical protein
MPTRSFGLVDYKAREAESFLNELGRVGHQLNPAAVQYCASAFAAAARSVTFAMQASLAYHPSFSDWYSPRQQALKQDILARFFHDFRRVSQHIGESVVDSGIYGTDGAKYFFQQSAILPNVPSLDVETACVTYFRTVLRLVFDCYVQFAPIVNAQWRYTPGFFASLGMTIEDAEEELGFPRGWTDIGQDDAEAYRWEMLRQCADECGLNEQFNRWLGLSVPLPGRLPPFP